MTKERRGAGRRQQRRAEKRRQIAVTLAMGLVPLVIVALLLRPAATPENDAAAEVSSPDKLSVEAALGESLFKLNCAECHGENAAGTNQGPPLVHDIYNPGHHSDDAFYRAVASGSRQHHWTFGDMPAQPEVTRDEAERIVRYIRELQEANGIVYKPHGA